MAYRYLDPVVGLGQHFSHWVIAMSVSQADIFKAISQRHNLSGLRLDFAAPSSGDPKVGHVRRLLGLERSAQQSFFDSLYEQSDGIFRSAFELWQDCIERVDAGVVCIRQPLVANYDHLLAHLTLMDSFALSAVVQHGSLTVEEMAQVMAISPESSRRQMERLTLLDILDSEPQGEGLRVRPESRRIVRELLSRTNLI